VTFSINVVHWRDLVKGSNLSSGISLILRSANR
jgi:hypothetical protein